jgi:hypothetical protein
MAVRRWLARLNLVVTLFLLGLLFIFVNFLSHRHAGRLDLTKTKITALSDKTKQVLGQLREPLNVVVFYQPTHRLYQFVRDLLKEYERLSPRFRVEYVDPDQDIARARQLVQQFEIGPDRNNLVVFQSGTRHKYLSDTDLAEYDYTTATFGGQPSVKAFKGEDAFTSAILNVTQARQPLVWVTTGHGEKSVDDQEPSGLSELKRYLERDNMQVESVNLLERPEIPQEVNAIVIPGPTHRFV